MDKSSWTQLIVVATILILCAALAGVVKARPRGQVVLAFVPTTVVASVIYGAMVDGAASFHRALLLCCGVALLVSLALLWAQPWRDRLATLSWAFLGVVAPYALIIGLLTAACAGKSECFG